ncbi:VOC family protein [Auraticoccus sp. F435]|uniref:VOC family protein n=1 Tax=Auraticoccus cholistanensis TaxID=2656650 RepID=A0A6A9UQA6_9ACTN|nr:VOC family protein [Auraticoccus cholistanensis]MVA74738.1 VOC family protein [Auraticoccus cholistanensis]
MTLSLGAVTVDSQEPGPLARWWAEQLGGRIVQEHGGFYYLVSIPSGGQALAFQMVEDPTPGKNRLHLDLVADASLDAEVDRLLAAGATEVARHELDGGFRWVTLADPQGNLFCVSHSHLEEEGTG